MAEATKSRAYVKDVTLSLGLVSIHGSLFNLTVPNKDRAEQFKSVCPDCAETAQQFLSSKLVCNDDPSHGPFTSKDVLKGREINGAIVVFDPTAVDAAKASVLPSQALSLQVHDRESVAASTIETGVAWVFKPSFPNPAYGIILDYLACHPETVLLAKANVRGTDYFFRVDRKLNGQLVIRQCIWPEDIIDFEEPDLNYDKKVYAQAEMLFETLREPFEPAEYRKDSRVRVASMVDEIVMSGGGKVAKMAAPTAKPQSESGLSMLLEAALAEAKKKKAPAKRASRAKKES